MRTFIKNIKQKTNLRTASFIVSVLISLLAIPAAVLAYGPDRPTFTMANPATYVTFDSITDDPTYGDERNFYRVRDVATGAQYTDTAALVAGHTYEAQIFYHNNASSDFNASGVGIAHNAYTRVDLPAIIKANTTSTESEAYIGASNANPSQVFDYIDFSNPTSGDMAIRYMAGSIKLTNSGALNGSTLGDSALFSSAGQPLGFDTTDGNLPACDHYSGFITFDFTAVQANFTFTKSVRVNGSGVAGWKNNLTVNPGTKVDYELAYTNTGNTEQDNVGLRDKLPAGVTYIPGSAILYNATNQDGKTIDDSIASNGSNIGDYEAGSNAYLDFSATINAAPCTVLTNTATAETDNGALDSSATVTVAGNCTAALPHTGPTEVIAGLLGVGAITVGVVYYFKSRRDLEDALLHVQAHPTSAQNLQSSAPETTKVEDVEAEHKHHKKSEHHK